MDYSLYVLARQRIPSRPRAGRAGCRLAGLLHRRRVPMKSSKQQDSVSARAPLSEGLRKASKVNPEKPKVWIPYLKFSGRRQPNGCREWALSWRTVRAADLRSIWNGPKVLDKQASRSERELALAINKRPALRAHWRRVHENG